MEAVSHRGKLVFVASSRQLEQRLVFAIQFWLCNYPRMSERLRVEDRGEAVMFLIVCGREVMLQKRPLNGKGFEGETIVPGGKVEKGEETKQAASREIYKESGLQNAEIIQLGMPFRAITTSPHLYKVTPFLVFIQDKNLVTGMNKEEGEIVWMLFEDAIKIVDWAHCQVVFERARPVIEARLIQG